MKKMFVYFLLFGIILFGCKKKDAALINSKGCVECDKYAIGDMFTIDGVTYTVADRKMLNEALEKGEDLTKYCTSKVTRMNGMFQFWNCFSIPVNYRLGFFKAV